MHPLRSLLLASTWLALLACAAYAQNAQDTLPGAGPPGQRDMGRPTEEMISRAVIKHEEEQHKEMVERADEAALLGGQLLNSFRKNRSLDREDLKKLDRLEKLARKIRGGAGGSDDDEPLEDPPQQMDAAVSRLSEVADKLNKSVQKTSRLVISAAVINSSNELIELIKHIRAIPRP